MAFEDLRPTEVWTPDRDFNDLDDAIDRARDSLNRKNPQMLISDLMDKVEKTPAGVTFAVLKGPKPEKYSETSALVMFNPFANGATPNMLVRTEFIREVARFANVRDETGELIPAVMMASPGVRGSNIELSIDERKQIRQGDLGPFAKELLSAVSHKEIGRVALCGFSQGADVALAGAREAYSANLDVGALSVGDPAGVINRNTIILARDFGNASPELETDALKSNLEALDMARHMRFEYTRFALSTLYPSNWYLLGGAMGKETFETRMQQIIDEGKVDSIVAGYGEKSTIAPPESIEPVIQRLYESNGKESFISIKVKNARHSWGDNLNLLARLYLRALR